MKKRSQLNFKGLSPQVQTTGQVLAVVVRLWTNTTELSPPRVFVFELYTKFGWITLWENKPITCIDLFSGYSTTRFQLQIITSYEKDDCYECWVWKKEGNGRGLFVETEEDAETFSLPRFEPGTSRVQVYSVTRA
jgi:hypothetical protein